MPYHPEPTHAPYEMGVDRHRRDTDEGEGGGAA